MATAVATWTGILRAAPALAGITVEQYWRMEPPVGPTVYVEPREESGETGFAIGPHWASDLTVDVVVEVAWDDRVETAETLSAIVEAVKAVIAEQRNVLAPLVATHGLIEWRYAQRPGSGTMVRLAVVPIECRFPVRGA